MKRLWKYIPPCLSDVQGFQAVINETDGMGIVDDPSRYKFIPGAASAGNGTGGRGGKPWDRQSQTGASEGRPAFGGKPERGGFGGHDGSKERAGFGGHGKRGEGGFMGGRGHGGPGFGGRGGHPGMAGNRVVQSDLRNEDIISGTESKILQAFEQSAPSLNPKFVLLCNAPSSSMISSDLEMAAYKINQSSQLPAMALNLHGDKDYLYGVSLTLEALGKLLLKKAESVTERGINILGCNTIDFSSSNLDDLKALLAARGWNVLSCWGAKNTTSKLQTASSAQVNLVVNISGLRIAKYMYDEFEIPFVVGAPFGSAQTEQILNMLEQAAAGQMADAAAEEEPANGKKVLYVGEQLLGNAIRACLKTKGYGNVIVTSLYDMDKTCMLAGDKKLNSEDDLAAMAGDAALIIADPDCKGAVKGAAEGAVKWVNLPNSGMSIIQPVLPVDMVGEKLDKWLENNLG